MDIKQAFGSCPRCGTGVDYREQVTVCHNCGWMPDSSEHNKSYKKSLIALCFVLALAFVHMINWGEHSFSIISLKAKSNFGTASLNELKEMAQICEQQLKYECAANALENRALLTKDATDFKNLGDLYRRMSQWSQSIDAYNVSLTKYPNKRKFRTLRADAYYGLAKALHETGELASAETHYKKALRLKPGVLQVTVTTDYIKLLKQAGRITDAKRVLASAERRSGSKGRFSALVDL